MMIAHLQTENKTSSGRFFMPALTGLLQRKCACGNHTMVGGKCDECKKKQSLQRKISDQSEASEVPPIAHEVLRSPGQPLDPAIRAFMEPRFGHDFSQVRVHTDTKAAESARAVNALAYTVGRDVVFGTAQYAPETSAGRVLIAHELTHTLQQSENVQQSAATLTMTSRDDVLEREADTTATAVLQGIPFTPSLHKSIQLARYGHARSCKDDIHLKPFIWPGHAHAKSVTGRALQETDVRPLNPQTKANIENFFGKGSADTQNLQTIHDNYQKIQQALGQEYLYHCVGKGAGSDANAIPCKGQNAETSQSGKNDITFCFDQIGTWWSAGDVSGAAYLIIHENYHRAGTRGHSWEAGKFDNCIFKPPHPTAPDLTNADAYACFAALITAQTP